MSILDDKPKWLLHAYKDKGQHEIAGPGANPRIVAALHCTDLPENMKNTDETPNCAAGLNLWLKECGMKGTGHANARSFLTYGIHLDKPRIGAIVILNRGGSPDPNVLTGPAHVTLIDAFDATGFYGFGWNQSDQVKLSRYSWKELLDIRWPEE